MKKITSAILSFIMIFTLCAPLIANAAVTGRYIVASDVATVYSEPDLLSAKSGEVYGGTYVTVTEISRGFGKIFIYSSGVGGWVQLAALAYAEKEEPASDITGISITKPSKLTYTEGEEALDLTGMKVYAIKSDGKKTQITGYKVFADSFDSYGTKSVRVSYTPSGSSKTFTASFNVTVVRVPLKSLSVSSKPKKNEFLEHEKLDLTGLKLKATYSDGRAAKTFTLEEALADKDIVISGCHDEKPGDRLEAGKHTFNIYYKYPDISASFTINAAPRKLTNIRLLTPPKSTVTYSKTKAPSIKGLTLEAFYDNGETETIPYTDCEVTCDPSSFILGEGNPVYIGYGDFFVTVFFRLAINEPVGIKVTPPKKLSYVKGEKIDLSVVYVELIYDDGTLEPVSGFTMSELDPERSGSQNIIVTYGEYSDVFTISITPYYQKGDADGNGEVEPEDARITMRAAVSLIKLSGLALTAADMDEDGAITTADARLILRKAVGLDN